VVSKRALTVKELAEHFRVGEGTVLRWIRSGELRAVNVGRRPGAKKPRWRITPEALETFELVRTHNAPPPPTRRRRRQAEVVEFY